RRALPAADRGAARRELLKRSSSPAPAIAAFECFFCRSVAVSGSERGGVGDGAGGNGDVGCPAARPQELPAAPLRGGVTAAAAPACSSFLSRTGEPFRRRSSRLPPSPPPSPSRGAGLLSSHGDGTLA
ncbi:unnamed protein product, partial [Ectocarpus sp. 4 AP-2014]